MEQLFTIRQLEEKVTEKQDDNGLRGLREDTRQGGQRVTVESAGVL